MGFKPDMKPRQSKPRGYVIVKDQGYDTEKVLTQRVSAGEGRRADDGH